MVVRRVHIIDDPLLETYLSKPYGKGLSDLCQKVKPEIVLIGATSVGRDLASIVATTIETGLTADCTGLDIDEEKRLLLMTRPTFGGNIMATIYCEHYRPQMSTVRPKVFKLFPADQTRKGDIFQYSFAPPPGRLPEIVDFEKNTSDIGTIDITRYPALVVAGKGACDPESMPLLLRACRYCWGIVACSRPVVEAGLMPYERQVGQTGKTVAPNSISQSESQERFSIWWSCGGREKIVAINPDPKAPIFNVASSGIVGDYKQMVPLLIKELKKDPRSVRASHMSWNLM